MIGTIAASKNENYNRGVALYDQGLYTESIAEFERVLESVEKDAPEAKFASFYMCEAYANLGLTHLRMNMYRRAEKELKLALVLNPEYADLHCCLGVTYYKQGRYDEAETHLRKSLKINPAFARASLYLGMTRLRKGDNKGLDDIGYGVCIEPAYQGDKYEKALIPYCGGNLDKTLLMLEEIAETDTDQIGIVLNRGLDYLNQGRYEEAANEFLDAVSSCPHYADLRHYLGLCYLNQGMAELAVGQFRKALEINPTFRAARMSLAGAYAEDGRTDLAVRELDHVLEYDPGNVDAMKFLARLNRTA